MCANLVKITTLAAQLIGNLIVMADNELAVGCKVYIKLYTREIQLLCATKSIKGILVGCKLSTCACISAMSKKFYLAARLLAA